jgi:hypothetical protein
MQGQTEDVANLSVFSDMQFQNHPKESYAINEGMNNE